ncbi:MAG: FkbM family methyltransferase [Halioglobus sp.]|jgi:FkbM family methyltransferase
METSALFMKKVVAIINSMLATLGIRLVSTENGSFNMSAAIERASIKSPGIRTIIDIGASNGTWSKTAMRYFTNATVFAVEPLEEREESLKNLKRKYDNFDYELCVAGDTKNTSVSLNVSNDLDGSTVDGSGGQPRIVPGTTIDSLASNHSLTGPFLLKFDTHGYELPILSGAENTLKNTDVIIMETYNFQLTDNSLRFHEMCHYLEKLGFRCYDVADPMLRKHDQAFWQIDLFFIRETSDVFSYNSYSSDLPKQ